MAIGWLSVLKMVPWNEVISNAPLVADGARKLWSAVAKKPPPAQSPGAGSPPTLSAAARSIAVLQAQLAATEAQVSDLHNQMLESSALIKALAEQNTQLIQRVEVNRIRTLWVAAIVAVLSIVVATNLAITLAR